MKMEIKLSRSLVNVELNRNKSWPPSSTSDKIPNPSAHSMTVRNFFLTMICCRFVSVP